MKRFIFGTKELQINSPLLNNIIDVCLSEPTPTRSSVSERSGASLTTVGKVLNALVECRFMKYDVRRPEDGSRLCKHHALSAMLSVLVIDLSSADYAMTVIEGHDKCVFFEKYRYDFSISYQDNLERFLSIAGVKTKGLKFGISSICLLCDDRPQTAVMSPRYASLILKDESALKQTKETVKRIFGMLPALCMGIGDAIASSLFYNIPGKRELLGNVAYIYFGEYLKAVFYPQNAPFAVCRPDELLVDEKTAVKDLLYCTSSEDLLSDLLTRTVNFMHCAFSPDTYIVEYDEVKFNEMFLRKLKRSFAILGHSLPEIRTSRMSPGFATLGCARMASAELIRRHIISK